MRELLGKSEEILETDASTIGSLFEEICQKYSLSEPHIHLKFARNEEYVSLDAKIKESDTVAFIPPVSGG